MLKIVIPETNDLFNESDGTFVYVKETSLTLEHSLVSVSKWESKSCVPFLSKRDKSKQEVVDYIRCMTLTQNVDDLVYAGLLPSHFDAITEYISAPMTATIITDIDKRVNPEVITSELLYYWMIVFNVPFECQKWHFNRLLTLLKICSIKQEKPKKLGRVALAQRNSALNAQRRSALNTRG